MTARRRRMLLFAAGFPEPTQGSVAAAALRRVLDTGGDDLSVGEVAGDAEFVGEAAVVLAGRIREFRMDEATEIIRGCGGVILTNVPERWTTPSLGPSTRA